MTKKMTVNEVIDYICDNDGDFAFRGDSFIPADKFNNSHYHGDDMEEYELPGVSAVYLPDFRRADIVKAICRARNYGDNVFLLTGRVENADEVTGDPDEVLVVNHEIVCIVDAEFTQNLWDYSIKDN